MHRNFKLVTFLALGVLAAVVPGRADETAEKGREVFKANHTAVVTVQVVAKMSSGGARSSAPRESKQDVTAIIVDPSGLAALALSSVDPTGIYERMNAEEYSKNKIDVEVTDLKILLEDGTEMPAEIVLRDKDLDLAFIRPKVKPTTPMPAVDLAKSSPAQALDVLVVLNRLNRASGRAYSASAERISAVIQKPRTFYVPDGSGGSATLGSPAFALDGNIVGMVVMRAVNASGSGSTRENVTAIILPAEDILKAAKQAPESKAADDAKKDSTK